jgi:hypothetical protein
MMNKSLTVGAVMLALASQAFALLPPLFNSRDEIKGMLESQQLGQVLESGELIQSIVRTEGGFEIKTNKHRVHVTVQPVPQDQPGPAQFDYVFDEPEEL